MNKPIPEFMVRVLLPKSSEFHCSPSGDSEYDDALKKAIFAVKPYGFEVVWPKLNEKWPVDSEGLTWVRLRCADDKEGLAYFMNECRILQKKIEKVKEATRSL
jgi:hypothetical protein